MYTKCILGVIIAITLAPTIPTLPLSQRSAEGIVPIDTVQRKAVPVATSGDNVYVAWWTNKTANNND
jgi:hypothetical protein